MPNNLPATRSRASFYHSLGKVNTYSGNLIGNELYKSAHNVTSTDVWMDIVPFAQNYASASSFDGNGIVQMIGSSANPSYCYPLTGTNYQTWFLDSGTPSAAPDGFVPSQDWVKPMINPSDVPNAEGAPSEGYKALLYKPDGSSISYGGSFWDIDYYAGLIRFDEGFTPIDSGNGMFFTFNKTSFESNYPSQSNMIGYIQSTSTGGPRALAFKYVGALLSSYIVPNIEGVTAGDGLSLTSGILDVLVDGTTIQINGSNQLEAINTILAGAGLTSSGYTMSALVDGITIQINGNNELEAINTILAGAGLTSNGGTFSVLVDGTTIQINGSNQLEAINTTLAGSGLTSSGNTMNVLVDGITIQINGNNELVAVDATKAGFGLTSSGYTMSVLVDGTTIQINGNNELEVINTILAGAGLTSNGGTFSVLVDGTTIQINGNNELEVINTILAGAGLTSSGGTFSVLVDGVTIQINGNNQLEAISNINVNAGLTSSGGTVSVLVDGVTIQVNGNNQLEAIDSTKAGAGLTSSGYTMSVLVDGVTIQVNGNNQLEAISSMSFPVYQLSNPGGDTLGNNATTSIVLNFNPSTASRIQVYVNGQLQRLGDGVTTRDCYFGTIPSSPKNINTLVSGDELFWNGSNAGFNLYSDDKVDIIYEK